MNTQKSSRMYRGLIAPAWFAFALLAVPPHFAYAHAEAQAQTQAAGDRIVVTLSDPSRPATVSVDVLHGGITVKGGDTKEIIIEARVRGGRRESESKSGGMRRLAVSSTGLAVEEQNNKVDVEVDALQRTVDVTLTVPRQTSLKLSSTNNGNIVVSDVEGEFDVDNTNGSVTLTNISGSAVAHALNGRVLVTFVRVNQKSMAFSSLNGHIDVTFPADLKANVSFDPGQGDVFTDFDVQLQSGFPKPIVEDSRGQGGKYKVQVDQMIRGTINGGGPEIQFTNFNGNIYLRKAGAPGAQ